MTEVHCGEWANGGKRLGGGASMDAAIVEHGAPPT